MNIIKVTIRNLYEIIQINNLFNYLVDFFHASNIITA